jgi:two-component system chemotaxis response regulator CheB
VIGNNVGQSFLSFDPDDGDQVDVPGHRVDLTDSVDLGDQSGDLRDPIRPGLQQNNGGDQGNSLETMGRVDGRQTSTGQTRVWADAGPWEAAVSHLDTIVIGASAGGVEALQTLLAGLPADFKARVLVVLHLPPIGATALASILDRNTELEVRTATNRDRLEPGVILVARPDHHLVVVDDNVLLTRGPRENGHRPAIDVLFRSAAQALGPRVIGLVLSGALDDGASGLRTIRSCGGLGVVQDPDDAQYSSMPLSAIAAARPEHVLPVKRIPALLTELIGIEVPDPPRAAPDPSLERLRLEVAMAEMDPAAYHEHQRPGTSSGLTCPDCQGVLFTLTEAGSDSSAGPEFVRYRCRVGHAWSPESLLAENRTAVEGALWMALRTLEEKAALCADLSERANRSGARLSADRFADQGADATMAAEVLRDLLAEGAGYQNLQEDADLG